MGLQYNGIDFPYPLTKVNVSSPGMDPSNSDQLFTEIKLEVQSILSHQAMDSAQLGGATDASEILAVLRHKLTAPRRPLFYDVGSLSDETENALKPIIRIPDGRDDGGGPLPDPAAFKAYYNTPETIVVSWSCLVKLTDCTFAQGSKATPLSIRWSDSISWDRYFKATWHREGTCIISSRSVFTIDDVRRRGTLTPTVPAGFARVNSQYVESKDGLRCDFRFTDEQMRFAPPYPAVDMDILQSESLNILNGMYRKGIVTVRMKGVMNANPIDLSQLCTTVGYARVFAALPLTAQNKIVGNAEFGTREGKDYVEANMTIEYTVIPQVLQNKPATGTFWNNVGAFGVANALIFAANNGPPPALTQQGLDPAKTPPLPWVGFGTTPPSKSNPAGFAPWASPNKTIVEPVEGTGSAVSVSLWAALLNDPCGQALSTTPFADTTTDLKGTGSPLGTPNSLSGLRSVSVTYQPGPVNGVGQSPVQSQIQFGSSQFSSIDTPTTTDVFSATGLFSQDAGFGVYDLWQCENEYVEDAGAMVLPVCNPAGKNIYVNPTSPTIVLRRKWAAKRSGSPPTLPPKGLSNSNWIYTGGIAPSMFPMGVAADGVSIVYEARGVYEYQALDPNVVIPLAEIPPFLNQTVMGKVADWANKFAGTFTSPPSGGTSTSILSTGGGSPLGGGTLLGTGPSN